MIGGEHPIGRVPDVTDQVLDHQGRIAALEREAGDNDAELDVSDEVGGIVVPDVVTARNAFWYSSLSGTSVTIGQGHLIFHRKGAWLAASQTVTLIGIGNTYVVATASRADPSDFSIGNTSVATIPTSTASVFVFPLHMFNSSDGITYTWVVNLLAGTAIQLGAPI